MKKVKISIFFLFALLVLAFSVFAAQINSANYEQNIIVSVGGENVSSSSYKMGVAMGIITKVIESASYINRLGFFHTWLLANNQPCTTASQCEGGFCCSNLCKSSACPSGGGGESPSGGGGAGGGGGGGGAPPINETPESKGIQREKDFSVSPNSIKEHIKLGAAKTRTVTIKNKEGTRLDFNLRALTVNDLVFLSEDSFSLDAAQEKNIEVNIIGKKLGSYLGEIEVTADGIKKSVNVVIEVESQQVLFDAKISIPPEYREVEPGDNLRAQITLLSIGQPRKVDVIATYIIKDKRGNVIYESSETFAVDNQASFVKSFKIPGTLQPDDYLVVIEVRYENSFAVSSELFKVVPKRRFIGNALRSNAALMAALIVFVGLLILFMYSLIPRLRNFKKYRKKIRK